jgi:uncharacterized protein (TIGR02453 family)
MASISKDTLLFLSDLKENNHRPWFQENKARFDHAKENVSLFLQNLESEMNKTDEIDHAKLYRIYRDVRFSKDKTPYKSSLSMYLSRRKPELRGGYYVSIGADEGFIGCGFWGPNTADLNRIREHISSEPDELRKIINEKIFLKTFKTLDGNQLKTSPRGYAKDHPAVDLLRYKQYLASKRYNTDEMLKPGFYKKVAKDFQAIRPFFDYMSYILGHDLNGVPIY